MMDKFEISNQSKIVWDYAFWRMIACLRKVVKYILATFWGCFILVVGWALINETYRLTCQHSAVLETRNRLQEQLMEIELVLRLSR
jgi:hypothetical protein